MSKQTKNTKKTEKKYDRPGRPMYVPKFPEKDTFTFMDFLVSNGVNPKTGKGKNCTVLTLRKWLKRDKAKGDESTLILVESQSTGKRGRKAHVYTLRKEHPIVSVPIANANIEHIENNSEIETVDENVESVNVE